MSRQHQRAFAALSVCMLWASVVGAAGIGFEELPRAAASWQLDFDEPVLWQRVTPLGSLLVATAAGLSGVDPATGKVAWTHVQLGSLDESSYEEIAATPLVVLSRPGEDSRVVVLDSETGKIAFDSYRAGVVRLLDKWVMPRTDGLLVMGFREGQPKTTLFLFDLATGMMRWSNDELAGSSGGSRKLAATLGALLQATTGASGVTAAPFELSQQAFLMASRTGVYKIDSLNGKFLWRAGAEIGPRSRFFVRPGDPKIVYFGTEVITEYGDRPSDANTYYMAFGLDDGARVWQEPVAVSGRLNDVVFLDHGLVVSSGSTAKGAIKLVDYSSGESLWGKKGKGVKTQGGVVDYDLSSAGLVVTTGYDSAWTNKGTEYFLNIVDTETGEFRFKQPLKVRGRIRGTEALDRGVLFVTTSEADVINPTTGASLARQGVRSKETLVTASRGARLFAFSRDDGALYAIDRGKGSVDELSKEKITLEEPKSPLALELYGDQLLLSSSQELVAFAPDGKLQYHVHYPAPKQPALLRALYTANAVRASMASVAAGAYGVGFAHVASQREEGELDRTISEGLAQGYGEMSEGFAGLAGRYFDAARQRFEASARAADHVYMMVQFTKKSVGLARVSKKSGEIEAVIDLGRDRSPSYQVDAIANRIYYRESANRIVCYGS